MHPPSHRLNDHRITLTEHQRKSSIAVIKLSYIVEKTINLYKNYLLKLAIDQ